MITTRHKVIAGAAVLGSTAWVVTRLRARTQLRGLVEASPSYQQAVALQVLPWLLDSRIAKAIPLLGFKTVDDAYFELMDELRAVLPKEPDLLITEDLTRSYIEPAVEKAKSTTQSIWHALPDVPFIDTSKYLPTWVTSS